MGLLDSLRGQFVDVIERVDDEGTTLVTKYERPGDEIKQGRRLSCAKASARSSSRAARSRISWGRARFASRPRTCRCSPRSPRSSTAFNSPVKADLYFVNTRQFVDNAWGTRNSDHDARPRAWAWYGCARSAVFSVPHRGRRPVRRAKLLAARRLFSTYGHRLVSRRHRRQRASRRFSRMRRPRRSDFATGYRELHAARVAESASRGRSGFGIRLQRTSSSRTPPCPTRWSSSSTSSPASPSREGTWLRSSNTRTPAPSAMRRSRKTALPASARASPSGGSWRTPFVAASRLELRKADEPVAPPMSLRLRV